MLALALTLLAVVAGLAAATALRVQGVAARLLVAGTLACAQVVCVQTILGAAGVLTRPWLAAGALFAAAMLLGVSVLVRGGELAAGLAADARGLLSALAELRHPELAFLAGVGGLAWAWVLGAILWLPPRSVDDLAYHLPPILEAAVQGRFVILPLDLRPWFAYPLTAELLMLWPTILRGDIAWVDASQAATSFLAAAGIVAIGRGLGATRRASLLAALLFLLMPITLRQASSCYTDISIAGFYAAALWGALSFARQGDAGALLTWGIATGLIAGTKYHFGIVLIGLLPFFLPGWRHAPGRGAAWVRTTVLFALPALAIPGYWYLRNLVVLGNPFYPYRVGLGPLTIFPSGLPAEHDSAASPAFFWTLLREPLTAFAVSLRDVGAGGVDGGLGPAFWGAVLPVALGAAVLSVWRLRGRGAAPELLLALQFPVAFVPYLISPKAYYDITARFLIASCVPGLALLAMAVDAARRRWAPAAGVGIVLAGASCASSVLLLAGMRDLHERKQMMIFGPAASSARAGETTSAWRFIGGGAKGSSHGVSRFAPGWEMLDLLSATPGEPVRPLWVYATGQYAAGFYGTWLQNRVWNFNTPGRPSEPEVYFYYLTIQRRVEDITYFGQPVWKLEQVLADPDRHDLVLITPETLVFVRRDLIVEGGGLRGRLARYYETVYPEEILTASSLDRFPRGGTIVNSGAVGYGLKALELRGRLASRVVLARPEDGDSLLARYRTRGPLYIVAPAGAHRFPVAATMKGTREQLALYELGAGRTAAPIAGEPGSIR